MAALDRQIADGQITMQIDCLNSVNEAELKSSRKPPAGWMTGQGAMVVAMVTMLFHAAWMKKMNNSFWPVCLVTSQA